MKFSTVLLAGALLLTPSIASAGVLDGILDGWSGESALTGARTTGNTETTDVGLSLKVQKETDVWRHKFKALGDYGEANDTDTKQRYSFGYQIDRDVTERLYVYGNADYFSDTFGAFKNGYFLGGGLGYNVLQEQPLLWNLEGGAGYRSQKSRPAQPVEPETENEFALRGFSDLDYTFNDNVSLYNDTEILWSSSDTYIWNEAGITAKLAGNLAVRASYRVDNHSNPPVGAESTDTTTRFGIVYTLK